jgi:hypothetical protein
MRTAADYHHVNVTLRSCVLWHDEAPAWLTTEAELDQVLVGQLHRNDDSVRAVASTLSYVAGGVVGTVEGDGELWPVAVTFTRFLVPRTPFNVRFAPLSEPPRGEPVDGDFRPAGTFDSTTEKCHLVCSRRETC